MINHPRVHALRKFLRENRVSYKAIRNPHNYKFDILTFERFPKEMINTLGALSDKVKPRWFKGTTFVGYMVTIKGDIVSCQGCGATEECIDLEKDVDSHYTDEGSWGKDEIWELKEQCLCCDGDLWIVKSIKDEK